MPVAESLLRSAQAGDPAALAVLLGQLRPDIRRYARRQCHRGSVLEDVVQEALIVVYRKVGSVRSASAMGGWLLTVIARLCMLPALMWMRGVDALADDDERHRFAAVAADDLRLDLARALESLPPAHRDVVLLRDFEELTLAEIAARLGVTVQAAKSRLHRARGLLREYLTASEARQPGA